MVHRNLWSGNILLAPNSTALLSDYGLSDIIAEEVMYATHKSLAALGYLAPEYAYLGQVTENSDIYAFGALVLEILTGLRPVDTHPLKLADPWKVREFVDPKLEARFVMAEAVGLVELGVQCMAEDVRARPSMAEVVKKVEEGWADTAMAAAMAGPASFSHGYGDGRHQCR